MRISPVYNISLLSHIKRHPGLTFEEIQIHNSIPGNSSESLKTELDVLIGMGEIELTDDGKYI